MPFPYSVLRCLALAKNKDPERQGPCRGSLVKVGIDGRAEMYETNLIHAHEVGAGMDSARPVTRTEDQKNKSGGKHHDG